jgi:DNA-binding response OmpR family regulator
MVVDDEPDITFTLQAGLEDGGFDVDAFDFYVHQIGKESL